MKTVLTFAALAAVASSFAGTYTVNTSTVTMTGTAATNVSFNLGATTGTLRGYAVSGTWSSIVDGGQWSSEFGTALTAPDGTTYVRRSTGQGASNNSTVVFSAAAGSTWNNLTSAYDLFNSAGSANGAYSVAYNQSYSSSTTTQQSQLAGSSLTVYTDAIAAQTGSLSDNSPTFNRPTSLTAVATGTGTGTGVSYTTKSFSLGSAGSYLLGANFTGLTGATAPGGYDGYLLIYSGAFDPANPLTNLIGLDDDGSVLAGTSSMLLSLGSGNYTAVFSEYSSTSIAAGASGNIGFYVAGGSAVPEPSAFAALGLGAVVMLRRRKRA